MIIAICLLAIYYALPNILPKDIRESASSVLSSHTLNLGLDLQGGVHLLWDVDFDGYLVDKYAEMEYAVRERLRKNRIGYRNLRVVEGKLVFTLRDSSHASQLEEIFKDYYLEAELEINGAAISLAYRPDRLSTMKTDVISQAIETVRRRVDAMGTREPIIQRQGDSRLLLQVPGESDPQRIIDMVGTTGQMTFHLMDATNPFPKKKPVHIPAGTKLLQGTENITGRTYYLVRKKVELKGDSLIGAGATFDEANRPAVSFRFDTPGARKFGQITKKNIGKPFAIVLDGKVISAPNIRTAILGGSGIITGSNSMQESSDLALLLRSGALPADMSVLEQRSVGPSLGKDSIEAGKMAAMLGVVLVVIFMIICYGLFGVFSTIALAMNMILIIAALSFFQATLTLPGIAGMVLTMGMAVDANVLIFERIREEISSGKTPFAAVDHAFRQALKTIVDSNITTLMATILLYAYGSGAVKGFAVTLSIGILASMFSAILLTRMMVVLWLKKNKPTTIPI